MTESGWPRNAALLDSPLASRVNSPSAMTPSASAVPTQTVRGRLEMLRPVCAQKPLAVGSTEPYAGRFGQNTQRPQITSNAGSSDSIAHSAMNTPIARTGPIPRVEFMSANIRHNMPRITVVPLATMAGPARCSASAIASCRSSCRRSSSR